MKFASVFFACTAVMFAADPKPLPNQAGNDNVDFQGTVLLTPSDIRQALGGNDLAGPGIDSGTIVVRLKVTPKSPKPLRIGPDDFTLLSRKNGERSPAMTPSQVVGGGSVLVLRPAVTQPGGDGTTIRGPVWGGVTTKKTGSSDSGPAPQVRQGEASDSPLIPVLTQYGLPDKELKTPEEGLLYFSVDKKLKPKDLSLIYEGEGGKLVIDFK